MINAPSICFSFSCLLIHLEIRALQSENLGPFFRQAILFGVVLNYNKFGEDIGCCLFRVWMLNVNTIYQKCNHCIETLNQWFIANRLHMKLDKANIMVFLKITANNICVKLS